MQLRCCGLYQTNFLHEDTSVCHFKVECGCITVLMLLEIPYTNNALSIWEVLGQGGVHRPAALLFHTKADTPSGLQWYSISLALHNLGDLNDSKQMEMITWGDVVYQPVRGIILETPTQIIQT